MNDIEIRMTLKKSPWRDKLRDLFFNMRHAFKRAGELFPLTFTTVLAAALIYMVWFWEVMPHANQILHAVVLLWLIFFAVIAIFTITSAILVFAVTRHANRMVILECKNEVNGHVESAYRVFNPFFMPFITVRYDIDDASLERHEKNTLLWLGEWIKPTGRGRWETLGRKITVCDIFGVSSIAFFIKSPAHIEISPAQTHFEHAVIRTLESSCDGYSHPSGDPRGDLVEMRRYEAGDPLRFVLWKVFARQRKLVVRAPEPTISDESDMFVYFISGDSDEPAAAMARALLQTFSQTDGRLYFATDGAKHLAKDTNEGISDLINSVQYKSNAGKGLLDVASQMTPDMMTKCFILIPPHQGAWLQAVEQFVAQFKIRPTFILTIDKSQSSNSQRRQSRLKRMLYANTDHANGKNENEKDALCKKLSPLGAVKIVDIDSGISRNLT